MRSVYDNNIKFNRILVDGNKFKPLMESGEFDIGELLDTAKNVLNKMSSEDKDGSGQVPINMIEQLLGQVNCN